MKMDQVAAQLYTLRDHLKTPDQVPETLKRVADIGFRAIQVSGIGATVPDALIKEEAAANNLIICATHDNGQRILNEPEAIIARLNFLGCKHTAYPAPNGIDLSNEDSVRGLIEGLNRAGQLFAEAGLTLSYHNHHHEFRKLNGRLILERIYEETNPAYLKAELDTYWVQYGGGDPERWCRKMAGRMPLIHLKDYKINEKSEINFSEIGAGNLDFANIIKTAEAGGCEWFIIEQDSCPGDPFESLRQSYTYLKQHLASRPA